MLPSAAGVCDVHIVSAAVSNVLVVSSPLLLQYFYPDPLSGSRSGSTDQLNPDIIPIRIRTWFFFSSQNQHKPREKVWKSWTGRLLDIFWKNSSWVDVLRRVVRANQALASCRNVGFSSIWWWMVPDILAFAGLQRQEGGPCPHGHATPATTYRQPLL